MLKLQQSVAELKTQLADSSRQHNEEIGELQNAVVKLRSQLEKSEAQRQSLEYQLTLAQKDSRQNLDLQEEREKGWSSLKESLQDRVSKLTHQCQEWRTTLDTVQEARSRERAEKKQLAATKKSELLQQIALYRTLELENKHLKQENASNSESLKALRATLGEVEKELSSKNKSVKTLSRELENAKHLGENYKLQLKAAGDKTQSLEMSVESLRSELHTAQLDAESQSRQVKELEVLLGEEQLSREQVVQALGETRALVTTLQSSLEREESKSAMISDQLQTQEQECQSLKQQKREKQSIISELSHQLQLHKSNFLALKEELNLAQQRQTQLEETHTHSHKEVSHLLTTFRAKHFSCKGHSEAPPTTDPSTMPARVRQMLQDVQSRLTELGAKVKRLTSDLQAEKMTVERLNRECTTYREVVTTRMTAIAEAEQRLSTSSKEISRLKAELSQSKTLNTSLQTHLEQLTQREQQTRSEHTTVLSDLSTLKKNYSDKMTSHCQYLHSLLASLHSSKTRTASSSEGSSDMDLISWGSDQTKLEGSVTTAVMALSEALKRTKREVKYLKATNSGLVATLESADTLYKESAGKLTSSMEAQEREWTQRTNELRSVYDSKLTESEEKCVELEQRIADLRSEVDSCSIEQNHKKTLLEQAEQMVKKLNQSLEEKTQSLSHLSQDLKECQNKEKERSLTNQKLEDQLAQVQEVHRGYKNDRACLLACTCLLAGSLFPALARIKELTTQRSLLLEQLDSSTKLHRQVSEIVQSIENDIGDPQSQNALQGSQCSMLGSSSCILSPLLRFRKIAIAVLAVNRLKRLRKCDYSLFSVDFVTQSSSTHHLTVHTGQRAGKRSKLAHSSRQHDLQVSDIASWLRSERVLSDVRESFSDLQSTLDSITSHPSKPSSIHDQSPFNQLAATKHRLNYRKVINPTRDSYLRWLEKMSLRFNRNDQSLVSSTSLCSRLNQGLQKTLLRAPSPNRYSNSIELGESLCTQLTALIGRLHDGETRRHAMFLQLEQHKIEVLRLSSACQEATQLESQVGKLREDLAGTVPHERYMRVCGDLESALKREQDLKASLTQHGAVVRGLQSRLQEEGQSTQTKSAALCVLEKGLSELRANLELKEKQLKDCRNHLELSNKERLMQAQQLGELQSALNTCRQQISMAHAAVAAESDKRLAGGGRMEDER